MSKKKRVLIITEAQAGAISDALERILADSPEIVFGSYNRSQQAEKWRLVEKAASALANSQELPQGSKVCIFSEAEADALARAAGNILEACDNKEILDFFLAPATVDAAYRAYEKLRK